MNQFLKVLYVTQSINLLADNLLIPLFALLVLKVGGNAETASQLWALQFFVAAAAGLILTKIADRPNLNYQLLAMNYGIKGLVWAAMAINQNLWNLVFAQVVLGVCTGIGGPALNSLVSENLDHEKHISNWSYLDVISHLFVGVSSVFGGILVLKVGFVSLFVLMSLMELGICGGLVIYHFKR